MTVFLFLLGAERARKYTIIHINIKKNVIITLYIYILEIKARHRRAKRNLNTNVFCRVAARSDRLQCLEEAVDFLNAGARINKLQARATFGRPPKCCVIYGGLRPPAIHMPARTVE